MLGRLYHPATRPFGRNWAAFVIALRVLAVLVGLQFTGFIHDVTDVVDAAVATHEVEHEDCPTDGSCRDCPPGCPNCHCSAVTASVVAEASARLIVVLPTESLPDCWYATQAPAGPERPSLFRPPRA